MKSIAKLVFAAVFAAAVLTIFFGGGVSNERRVFAQTTKAAPTPPANAANTVKSDGGKTIPKEFTLAKDSVSEYGEVAFNHENHAFLNYSPDGKSTITCVECHHTDQPKSALSPPLVTAERDVVMTLEVWKKSDAKVSDCRSCHYQDGSVPDDKTMPSATYKNAKAGGKDETKEITNELAYHINCNTCHDKAAAARPELKKNPKFATTNDCTICHKKA